MSEGALAVVIAPETSEEAGKLFAALLGAGFHPALDYGADDHGGPALANFPILVPQGELAEAKGYLRGLKARAPAQPTGSSSMFGAGSSDKPVGPLPPWKLNETVGKGLGVLLFMLVLVGGVTGLVVTLQFFASQKGH